MGLRVRSVMEPSEAEVLALREKRDCAARTIHLTGPPEVFGSTLPVVGDRVVVDLCDPRLSTEGCECGGGIVAGEALQVSRTEHCGFYTAFETIDRSAAPPEELFVRLLCD